MDEIIRLSSIPTDPYVISQLRGFSKYPEFDFLVRSGWDCGSGSSGWLWTPPFEDMQPHKRRGREKEGDRDSWGGREGGRGDWHGSRDIKIGCLRPRERGEGEAESEALDLRA